MTIVVIAHRLSTIKDADKIVVIKDGNKVEVGTNDSLLKDYPEGVYANFCAKQANAEANVQEQEAGKEDEEEVVDVKVDETDKGNGLKRKATIAVAEMSPEEREMKEISDEQDAAKEKIA